MFSQLVNASSALASPTLLNFHLLRSAFSILLPVNASLMLSSPVNAHFLISGFAFSAPLNMLSIFFTLFTFHFVTSGFADAASANISLISSTFCVFHSPAPGFIDELLNIPVNFKAAPVFQFLKSLPSTFPFTLLKAYEKSVVTFVLSLSRPVISPPKA